MRHVRVIFYLGLFLAPSALWAQQPDTLPTQQVTPPASGAVKPIIADENACPLVQAAVREAKIAMAAPPPKPSSDQNNDQPKKNKGDKKGDQTASPVKC